ncbi:MAG: hypothetical protein R3E97_09960 [Candidatus Eisenbacteria bacterium]
MGSERKSDWATPKPLPPGDRAATARVLDFLAAAQKDPARNVAYLGDDRDGIQSELEELVPSWEGTVRVCEDANGELRGVVLANWDTEIGLSWVYGPWTRPTDWDACASSLLDAALEQIPAGVTRYELSGACENAALAALAAERGAVSTDVNYALVLDGDALARISPSRAGEGFTIEEGGLVGRAPESLSAVDRDVLHELHEENFPTPYYSMDQLLAQHADGKRSCSWRAWAATSPGTRRAGSNRTASATSTSSRWPRRGEGTEWGGRSWSSSSRGFGPGSPGRKSVSPSDIRSDRRAPSMRRSAFTSTRHSSGTA